MFGTIFKALFSAAFDWVNSRILRREQKVADMTEQREADNAEAIKDASEINKADAAAGSAGVDAIRQRLLDEARP